MKREMYNLLVVSMLILLLILNVRPTELFAEPGDFIVEGVFEVSLDLPRILFILQRTSDGLPLTVDGEFYENWAFLDTGASGILLSRETVDYLDIALDPYAQYADVGVGGVEFFDVSEPLYVGTAHLLEPEPENPDNYIQNGPWRFQVKQYYAGDWPDEPIDILGMPVMAGKTVVLDAGAANQLDYFYAEIFEPDDPEIPTADFNVPLRFEKFINPSDPLNIPPLPVVAYNPVIDNVRVKYNNQSLAGTWLLDTGGTLSLISGVQGAMFGLTEPNGTPIVPPEFIIPVAGVGEDVNIPGYELDELILPTLNGYNLIYKNPRVGVLNIAVTDERTGRTILLDGVFGSNFLTASAKLVGGWPVDLSESPYHNIIIDMQNGLLGFDVNDVYPLPVCGDEYHPAPEADITGDCKVGREDMALVAENWLRSDCNSANSYCEGTDFDQSGKVNLDDFAFLAAEWYDSAFYSVCGDKDHPWPVLDLNRDCIVDFLDLRILADEWLNSCDELNWNCRGADFNTDDIVNLNDYAHIASGISY